MSGEGERRRRARGEGGISWDERRQRWIAVKTVGYDGRGKRVVRRGSGKSPTAALRELARRVKSYEAGMVKDAENYRVEQAVEDWLTHGQGDTSDATPGSGIGICARRRSSRSSVVASCAS